MVIVVGRCHAEEVIITMIGDSLVRDLNTLSHAFAFNYQ